jgi:ABC-type sugar transport system ATPase subunit
MIHCKNITLKQEKETIFKDFSLKVKAKERLVIVGDSGAGKSTLLRLIAGFIAPNSGEIYIDNTLVTQDTNILIPPNKRDISMIFQDLALWPHLDVESNIEFGLKIQKVPKDKRQEKVKEMLAMVGLEGYEKRAIETLSGGEQQRIALARTLALSPKIILMDEPLSSLDNTRNKQLRKQIVTLQEDLGFTLVYVTHNEEEAKEIGTRIFYLKKQHNTVS